RTWWPTPRCARASRADPRAASPARHRPSPERATMRFEHIVLLIIAFNVVSAVVQRRAKKAREKALRGSGGPPAGPNGAWGEDEVAGGAPASRAPRAEP